MKGKKKKQLKRDLGGDAPIIIIARPKLVDSSAIPLIVSHPSA